MKITYKSAHSPRWMDSSHQNIELIVDFDHCGAVPFGCVAQDTAHGSEIFARAVVGDFGPVAEYSAPVIVVSVPSSVSRFQARAALAQAGLFSAVDAYMSGLPADNIQRLAWQDATEFLRGSATVAAMATMLGLTESQVDQLFITAKGIEA